MKSHFNEVIFPADNFDRQFPAIDYFVILVMHFPFDNKFQLKKSNKNNRHT